ncbi:c-type cytochrome [Phenylobacterium sp.]|uniref:c-type cytochrome n=1 Tax=Phenylobacterium sp. TaxID=1871053 RepID=UPI0027326D30|nr:c-type cytochrome [Phenylobacterium sp.]MDP3658739.1 c-type cytochrome [Phenylobacterium sp.]
MTAGVSRVLAATLAAASLAACSPAKPPAATIVAAPESSIDRGKYLVAVMDCNGCHDANAFGPTPGTPATFLAGADVGFHLPGLGVFYPPNLTPDPEAGLGKWSEAEIVAAIRTGQRPDGRVLAPIMNWRTYANLTDADAMSVALYLKSLPPSPHRTPALGSPQTVKAPYLTVVTPEQGLKLPPPSPPPATSPS